MSITLGTSSQYHLHFMSIFCADILSPKKFQSQYGIREKLHKTLLHEKGTRKMLMKLTPGLNFINILCTVLMLAGSKSVRRYRWLTVFFMLFGSTSVIAVRKMLVKLTPVPVHLGRPPHMAMRSWRNRRKRIHAWKKKTY